MKTFNDWLPVVFFAVNVVQALILYSFRATLRIAVFELKESISDKYATKEDIARVEKDVAIAKRIDTGFANMATLIHSRGHRSEASGQ